MYDKVFNFWTEFIFWLSHPFHHFFDRHCRYVKSRFHRDSQMYFSTDCYRVVAKLLRKIEHIDLSEIIVFGQHEPGSTAFALLQGGGVGIVYEYNFSQGNPYRFAFTIAHEIRHYLQYKNGYMRFAGDDIIVCGLTGVIFKSDGNCDHTLYTTLPWEADANEFAATLVDVKARGIEHLHDGDYFFHYAYKNKKGYYQNIT